MMYILSFQYSTSTTHPVAFVSKIKPGVILFAMVTAGLVASMSLFKNLGRDLLNAGQIAETQLHTELIYL